MHSRRTGCLLLVLTVAGCAGPAVQGPAAEATLRIAYSTGRTSASAPDFGLAQVKQNLSLEPLASFGDDGRARPSVAEGWSVSDDRRTVTVRLRPGVRYQDGSGVTATDIATILKTTLPRTMGPAFEDVDSIQAVGSAEVQIRFRRASGFRLELLEVTVQKPEQAGVGTGPYMAVPGRANQLQANDRYYLGKPLIGRIAIQSYPTFRAAWADMLRGRNDMLYEVGVDALDSLRNAKKVAEVFTFPKRYQFVIILNSSTKSLASPQVRQGINLAIDRPALIRDALNGEGRASTGPVDPREWAVTGTDFPKLSYDVGRAAKLLGSGDRRVRFTCLVMPDHERLALVVKHQLEAVGVDMVLEEVSSDQLLKRASTRDFDAFLVDVISGPTMYRLYRFWHSAGTLNPAGISSRLVDAALDEVRFAASDERYRKGVVDFQHAVVEDPPAVFLAWSEGVRAISRRFDLPGDFGSADPIGSLRLLKPSNAQAMASRN